MPRFDDVIPAADALPPDLKLEEEIGAYAILDEHHAASVLPLAGGCAVPGLQEVRDRFVVRPDGNRQVKAPLESVLRQQPRRDIRPLGANLCLPLGRHVAEKDESRARRLGPGESRPETDRKRDRDHGENDSRDDHLCHGSASRGTIGPLLARAYSSRRKPSARQAANSS